MLCLPAHRSQVSCSTSHHRKISRVYWDNLDTVEQRRGSAWHMQVKYGQHLSLAVSILFLAKRKDQMMKEQILVIMGEQMFVKPLQKKGDCHIKHFLIGEANICGLRLDFSEVNIFYLVSVTPLFVPLFHCDCLLPFLLTPFLRKMEFNVYTQSKREFK